MRLCRDVYRRSLHFPHPTGAGYHQSLKAKRFLVPKLVLIAKDELVPCLVPFQVDEFFSFEFLFEIEIISRQLKFTFLKIIAKLTIL